MAIGAYKRAGVYKGALRARERGETLLRTLKGPVREGASGHLRASYKGGGLISALKGWAYRASKGPQGGGPDNVLEGAL